MIETLATELRARGYIVNRLSQRRCRSLNNNDELFVRDPYQPGIGFDVNLRGDETLRVHTCLPGRGPGMSKFLGRCIAATEIYLWVDEDIVKQLDDFLRTSANEEVDRLTVLKDELSGS